MRGSNTQRNCNLGFLEYRPKKCENKRKKLVIIIFITVFVEKIDVSQTNEDMK